MHEFTAVVKANATFFIKNLLLQWICIELEVEFVKVLMAQNIIIGFGGKENKLS
jgi:hypothetical protein